jgi:hypothetical protein
MAEQARKMSEIMKEMSETLLRNPDGVPSSEAAHVALLSAHVAWNESVGLDHAREGCRNVWETIEAENPALWNELKSNNIDAMIDELIRYKKAHYPNDRRRILVCGMVPGKVHVEWMNPAAPGVDSKWEMQLYGLVMLTVMETCRQQSRNVFTYVTVAVQAYFARQSMPLLLPES